MEKQLLEMIRQKQEVDKRLLKMEIVLGIVAALPLVVAVIIAGTVPMEEWQGGLLVLLSILPLLIATPFALKVEQKAGYYECKNCGHVFKPEFKAYIIGSHTMKRRKLRCPVCNEKSWCLRKRAEK